MDDKSVLSSSVRLNLFKSQMTALGNRPSNQDAMGNAMDDGLACFVMADGTGGYEGGEVASALVIDAVLSKFKQEGSFGARALRSYIDCAIVNVAQSKKLTEKRRSMSSTVAALLIDQSNRCALWAHLGDTRIYLFHEGKIKAMTKDHTLAQRFVDAGYASFEQLRNHPQRSVLYAAIGAEGDTFPEVTKNEVEIQNGDAFLICTDGFWEWIIEQQMEQTLTAARSCDEWLGAMSRVADGNASISKKKRDNYSAIAIWLREPIAPS